MNTADRITEATSIVAALVCAVAAACFTRPARS